MLIKLAVVVMLGLILFSLFSGLFFLYKDKGSGTRVVKALTFRITGSLFVFLLLLGAYRFGHYSQ